MERKELEAKGLTPEQIEFIMAENGKDIKAEQTKAKTMLTTAIAEAVKPLNDQIETLAIQAGEYQEVIKNSNGVDEEAKKQMEELQKTHTQALKEAKQSHEAELTKLRREAETREFFSSLNRKFITPETQRAFEQRVNEALSDKINEGKSRSDIFTALTKGEDGKERTDIFVPDTTAKPNGTGGTGDLSGGGGMYTMEQIRGMTPDQINKNWDNIKKVIEGSK